MSLILDRRQVLQLGALGAGALAIPGTATALGSARGFTHNVASGEPSQTSVLLWTRFVAPREVRLQAEVAETESFDSVVGGGEALASPERDHVAKLSVADLQPGRWYYYRFRAPDGSTSPVGRTRTLPDGPTGRFKLALFSCSNLGFGWFNAYAHAAKRDDIDLVIHVGDYLYEYQRGRYPDPDKGLRSDSLFPPDELVRLTDYRLRHAAYRSDLDLRRLHQLYPMIAMWDDHENANDSWEGGAQNHQPETEGPWNVRKAAAMRAYREWMPVSDNVYAEYRVGDLATIFRPETRLAARSRQLRYAEAIAGQERDPQAALIAFRDGPWQDPARTILGAPQEQQLAAGFKRSVGAGIRWQILAQQVVMGSLLTPPQAAGWARQDSSEEVKTRTRLGLLASSLGLPLNLDAWDGYPAARARLLKSAQESGANLVVLTGDTHNGWALDLKQGDVPAGVEFAGHSVTSPGMESSLAHVSPADVAGALVRHNPQLKWANTSRRGYVTVELTPDTAVGEWLFLDTILKRSTALAGTHRMSSERGSNRFSEG